MQDLNKIVQNGFFDDKYYRADHNILRVTETHVYFLEGNPDYLKKHAIFRYRKMWKKE